MEIKKNNLKIILFFAAAIILLLSIFFIYGSNKIKTDTPTAAIINGKKINLEVARTEKETARGLGNRDSLEGDRGMLFLFSHSDYYTFWMKDMRFSIDIIWLQDDTIVDISKNVPFEPGVNLEKLKLYQTRQKANRVLEVNAGFTDKNSIKIGDKIEYLYN